MLLQALISSLILQHNSASLIHYFLFSRSIVIVMTYRDYLSEVSRVKPFLNVGSLEIASIVSTLEIHYGLRSGLQDLTGLVL